MKMMHKLSVVLAVHNEAKNLARCLDSVKEIADEIIVVDGQSEDETIKIARKYGAKIISTTNKLNFHVNKQMGLDQAKFPLVLQLDADEVVTEKLKNEIIQILEKNLNKFIYKIKFNTFYLGKLIRYSGWQNEFHTRLFDKQFANYNDNAVHEFIVTDLPRKRLFYPIYHYSYPTLQVHLSKMANYSELGAEGLFKKGKKISLINAIFRGILKFLKMYFLQAGFLDGKNGLLLAFISSFGVSYKYFRLWELNNGSD